MIDWSNPPKPTGANWAVDFYNWFLQRTLAPSVPLYKELVFGTDIDWDDAGNTSSTFGLTMWKDHNEMVNIRGDVEVLDVGAAATIESAAFPEEYTPAGPTSRVWISTGGWGLNTNNGNIEPAIIGVAYSSGSWYLVTKGDLSGSKTVPFHFQVDIKFPHKEIL